MDCSIFGEVIIIWSIIIPVFFLPQVNVILRKFRIMIINFYYRVSVHAFHHPLSLGLTVKKIRV